MPNKNVIALGLRKIKEKHNLTNEGWSKISEVPVSTIARYLSTSSLNMPTFVHMCAMLRSVDEPIDEFYDSVMGSVNAPSDALKLAVVSVGVLDRGVLDVPEAKGEMQERLILQTEEMQRLKASEREKDMQIEVLEARLEMAERILESIRTLCAPK